MIKVAIIGGKIHSGGKKNLIMEYYRKLDKDKIQFDFICDSDSNSIPEEEINALGGRVFIIAPYEKIWKNVSDLYKILKNNDYDVVHCWNGTMNLFPLATAKLAGCKVRISESISKGNFREKKSYIKYALLPFSKLFATHYMANAMDSAIFQFGKKTYDKGDVAIFRSVIDTNANDYSEELRNQTIEKFGWQNKIVYGFIGRYVPQKNPIFLMEIFAALSKKQENAHFVTIGFGELEPAMMERANELKITNRLENLGRREDIRQFYNAFDAFLLPSLYEGMPMVGIEAQCSGLPIFMSSEITKETKGCDLAYFIGLDKSADEWADIIIAETTKNIPERKGMVSEVSKAGFDSKESAKRLEKYYFDALKK